MATKVTQSEETLIEKVSKMGRWWMCRECGYIPFNPKDNPSANLPVLKCPGCRQESLFMDVTCYAPGRGSVVGNIDMKLVGSYLNAKRMRKTL